MTIVFNAVTRKAVSRRIVKIPIENDAYDTSKNGIDEAGTVFTNVDTGNQLWFDEFNDNISSHYNGERSAIHGYVYGATVEQNLVDSVNQTDYNIFFEKGTNFNRWMIPKIKYMVNNTMNILFKSDGTGAGEFTTWDVNNLSTGQDVVISDTDTGDTTDPIYIQNITGVAAPYTITIFNHNTGAAFDLTSYTVDQGAYIKSVRNSSYEESVIDFSQEITNVLITGIAGGAPLVMQAYTVGDGHIVVNGNAWGIGQVLICDDGVEGAVFITTGAALPVGPDFQYNVREIAISGNIAGATTITGTFGGFSNLERQNLSGSAYDNALVTLAEKLKDYVYDIGTNSWLYFVNTQISALTANQEDRVAHQALNSTAHSDAINAHGIIDIWVARLDTGVGGKFTDTGINPLIAEMLAREVFTGIRLPQITTSLGGVVDNGNGTFTFSIANDDILYRLYQFIDYRINRVYGSMQRAVRQTNASNTLGTLMTVNTELNSVYTDSMSATLFTSNADGTSLIEVDDPTLFSPNDAIYIVSEGQPELSGYIISIRDNKINLTFNVDTNYTVIDLARIYKVL